MSDNNVKTLVSRVLLGAFKDLMSTNKRTRDEAQEFLLSEDCEMYCEAVNLNYDFVLNINFDNPKESLRHIEFRNILN